MAVICIAAALILGVLGIFSAKYRALAKEAFACALRTMTLRKCNTNFNEKLKAGITAGIGKISPRTAGLTFKHFSALSTGVTLIMFLSLIGFGWGAWNFYQYGNCNGPQSTDFCLFDPSATGETGFSRLGAEQELKQPLNLNGILVGNPNAQLRVYEYGCYLCKYTKKAESALRVLREEFKDRVLFVFKPIPLSKHAHSFDATQAGYCAQQQNKYWEMHTALFDMQDSCTAEGTPMLDFVAHDLNMNLPQFRTCMDSNDSKKFAQDLFNESKEIGMYGTPTFFIGRQHFVGSITYDQLKNVIEEELKKAK